MQKTVKHGSFKLYVVLTHSIQGVLATLPIFLTRAHLPGPPVPPLGDAGFFIVIFGAVIAGSGSLLPWLVRSPRQALILTAASFTIALALLYAYVDLDQRFIIGVPWSANRIMLYTSIGSTKTEFAAKYFPGKSEVYMLQHEGVTNEAINTLWSPETVRATRAKLFFSYFGILFFINMFIGAFARIRQLRERS